MNATPHPSRSHARSRVPPPSSITCATPGRGQRPHPRRQARPDRRVVEVVRLARAVADQPGAAVGGDEQRVGELGLARDGRRLEDLAQPCRPRPQRGDVVRRALRLVHVVAAQFRGERGRVGSRVVDQPDGDVRARHRVSVELHKTITADWRQAGTRPP